jgi:hypothetical protein
MQIDGVGAKVRENDVDLDRSISASSRQGKCRLTSSFKQKRRAHNIQRGARSGYGPTLCTHTNKGISIQVTTHEAPSNGVYITNDINEWGPRPTEKAQHFGGAFKGMSVDTLVIHQQALDGLRDF